jgi:hypothetical protein
MGSDGPPSAGFVSNILVMLLAQAGSAEANPILPATNEAVWSVITLGVAVLALVALVLLIRWASFNLGSQIGRLRYRSSKPR